LTSSFFLALFFGVGVHCIAARRRRVGRGGVTGGPPPVRRRGGGVTVRGVTAGARLAAQPWNLSPTERF